MSDDTFDVIIVGGGLAGCSAGLVLAQANLEVLIIERGNFCGAKNMTGGRLYGHSLEKIIPNFAQEAPIERKVTKEKISLMSSDGSVDIGFGSKKLSSEPDTGSYTVLRAPFDQWLASKAEEAGASIIPEALVEKLIVEDGKVIGVEATEEKLYADVVILADGVNSLLGQSIGMKKNSNLIRSQSVQKKLSNWVKMLSIKDSGCGAMKALRGFPQETPQREDSAEACSIQIKIRFQSVS